MKKSEICVALCALAVVFTACSGKTGESEVSSAEQNSVSEQTELSEPTTETVPETTTEEPYKENEFVVNAAAQKKYIFGAATVKFGNTVLENTSRSKLDSDGAELSVYAQKDFKKVRLYMHPMTYIGLTYDGEIYFGDRLLYNERKIVDFDGHFFLDDTGHVLWFSADGMDIHDNFTLKEIPEIKDAVQISAFVNYVACIDSKGQMRVFSIPLENIDSGDLTPKLEFSEVGWDNVADMQVLCEMLDSGRMRCRVGAVRSNGEFLGHDWSAPPSEDKTLAGIAGNEFYLVYLYDDGTVDFKYIYDGNGDTEAAEGLVSCLENVIAIDEEDGEFIFLRDDNKFYCNEGLLDTAELVGIDEYYFINYGGSSIEEKSSSRVKKYQ